MARAAKILFYCLALWVFRNDIGPRARAQDVSACRSSASQTAVIVSVEPGLEPVLADGRRLLIAGVETPPAVAEQARKAVGDWLIGRSVRLASLSEAPDRWGRIVAHLYAPSPSGTDLLVAFALADAGLARVRPHGEAAGCAAVLLNAEHSARREKLGLWALPAFAVVDANRSDQIVGRPAEWTIVEGRVQSVNTTRNRTYINFGPARNIDLAVTIARQNWKAFGKAGVDVGALRGKVIRVRGLLERRPGPQIEIALPQALEYVADRQLQRAARGSRTRL